MSDKLSASNITTKYALGEQPHEPTIIGTLALAGLQAAGVSGAATIGTFTIGATSISVATIVGTTIVLGASLGASLLLAPSADSNPMEKNDVTVRQAVPARFIDIGRVKSGGVVFFWDAALDALSRWTLWIGTILSCAEINDVETIYLNDEIPSWTGSYDDQSIAQVVPYGPNFAASRGFYTSLETGRGLSTDTRPNKLAGAFAAVWDNTAHKLDGLAYAVISYGQGDDPSFHANQYPQGPPAVAAVIKGCKLPDPSADMTNLATWAYSDNSARAVLRYLLDVDGWRLPAADIDTTMFATAVTHCNETVAGAGRYRSWGRYTTTEERRSVLADLLEACDGRLIEQPNGKAGLVVGRLVASNITITEADIIEAQWEPYGDTLDRVGSVRPRIVWESKNWQEFDLEPVNLPSPDADQALKQIDMPLKFCPSDNQAFRLAGARLRQLNPRWRGTITTRLVALQAFGDRWIDIVFAPLGINQQFEIVDGISLNLATMTCTLNVRSVQSDDYDWGDD